MPPTTVTTTSLTSSGPISRTFGFLMFLFGWTAVLATALGFFGNTWWPLDVLADWRFILAVVLVLAAVVTGFGYSRASAAVFGIAAVINLFLIAPLWLEEQPVLASSDVLRVISLDIGASPDVRGEVLTWVNSVEGDLVILANAGSTWLPAVEELGVPYRIVNEDPGLTGGTVVLARHDLEATIEERPTGMGTVDVVVEVPLAGQRVQVVGLSVERPVSASATQERIDDFVAINAAVRRLPSPVVIVGNLEASRWSKAFGALARELNNSEDGFGYQPTYPALEWPFVGEYAGIAVDHALYDGAITVAGRRIGPALGPSHRPLVVDLSPARAEAS